MHIFLSCVHGKGLEIKPNPMLVFNVISHLKEAGLLTEKADSRSGAGYVQGEPGTFCPARNQGTTKDY